MLHSSATALNPRHRIALSLALLVVWLVALPENHGGTAAGSDVPITPATVYLPLVQRACAPVQLIQDGGFEAGLPNPAWQTSSNVFSEILDDTPDPPPHSGTWKAWLGGADLVQESLWQVVNVPTGTLSLRVSYWWRVSTLESTHPFDIFQVQIRDAVGNPLETLETLTDADVGPGWQQSILTMATPYAGRTIQLAFIAETDDTNPTSFFVDDVSVLKACPAGLPGNIR